jgi:hypothetical protein
MSRRIKKYEEACEKYGLDLLKDLRDFFGRKHPIFHKIVRYHQKKKQEEKRIEKISTLVSMDLKISTVKKKSGLKHSTFYRFIEKHKKKIFTVKQFLIAFFFDMSDFI